jgi:ATP-binding cassette subfamily B (MDR/TAP) protein 1
MISFKATMRHDIEWFDDEKNSVSRTTCWKCGQVTKMSRQTGAVTGDIADLPQKVQGLFGPTLGSIIQSCATLLGGCIIGLCYGPCECRGIASYDSTPQHGD